MKYMKQLLIILAVSFAGELLHELIPLPVPASIYGLVLMFVLLCTGIIKLPDVKETADFLVEIMPMMFIPAVVGLLVTWDVLRPILIPVAVMTVVSTFVVMALSGHVTQLVMHLGKKNISGNKATQDTKNHSAKGGQA